MHVLVLNALHFAAERHAGQTRFNGRVSLSDHLIDVMSYVARMAPDPTLLAAAALHDVIEDTPTTIDEIVAMFGSEVAELVHELTDPKQLSRPEQIALQIRSMATKSPGARLIKICDQTSNIKAIVRYWRDFSDPPFLPPYVEKTRHVVEAGQGTAPEIEREFAAWYARFRAEALPHLPADPSPA